MKTKSAFTTIAFAALLTTLNCQLTTALAQGMAFTYQGRMVDSAGNPLNGVHDLRFRLFATATGGSPLATFDYSNVAVSNGLFVAAVDFGDLFDGNPRWLEIENLTLATVFARHQFTPTPYAIRASKAAALDGPLPAGQLSGIYSNALSLNNPANVIVGTFNGNGAGLSNLNVASVTGVIPSGALSNAWKIDGNAGTTPGTHFLGTTDNQPLELKVNGLRGLRLEPTLNSPFLSNIVNVVGGSPANVVGLGVYGATIGGGGAVNYLGQPGTNRVDAHFGVIGGGLSNTIQINADYATLGGGYFNAIQGNADGATLGGGYANTIQLNTSYATLGGGYFNAIQVNADYATLGGGDANIIRSLAFAATIGGGNGNTIQPNASHATIGGGFQNSIQTNADFATIPGGEQNTAANRAFAAGRRAKANHTGAFVWADATDADFASSGANQFLIRAAGGIGINKTNPSSTLDVQGTVTAVAFSGSGVGLTGIVVTNLDLAAIFHKGLERKGGESVRRLDLIEPDENTPRRHSEDRL